MKSTRKSDMRDLADAVRSVCDHIAPAFAAAIVGMGMMVPKQWWVRAAIRFGMWRHGCDASQVWFGLYLRKPELAREMIEQTASWITDGKDQADPKSVGGFNQGEVDQMVYLLSFVDAESLVA